MEKRTFNNLSVDPKKPKLKGYAAVFDELSEEFFGMREKIAKGAFLKSIKEDDVRMLWNHDPNYILARNKSGTLKIWEDSKGLAFEAVLPETQFAKDLLESVKRGDVSQGSFGFVLKKERWERTGEVPCRTILEAKLYDISPVVFPAYPATEVSLACRAKILELQGKSKSTPSWKELSARIKKTEAKMFQHEMDVYRKFFGIKKGGGR